MHIPKLQQDVSNENFMSPCSVLGDLHDSFSMNAPLTSSAFSVASPGTRSQRFMAPPHGIAGGNRNENSAAAVAARINRALVAFANCSK
jgi:hypothetical protein